MNAASKSSMTEDLIRLSYFTDIAKSIVSAATVGETLVAVMKRIGEVFAPANWSLLLKKKQTGELIFQIVVGKSAEKLQGTVIPRGSGIAGWIAENGKPVIIEDVSTDTRFDPSFDETTGFRTQSIIGVPLKADDRVYGVIELVNKLNGEPFTALELKLLTTIADFAGIAIEKAYYFAGLKKIAHVDILTGLFNRRYFTLEIEKEQEKIKRGAKPFCLLFIDADRFKEINDRHGHRAGDNALKIIARTLTECVRKEDTVCRYGGDEFTIIMPRAKREQADLVKSRINDKLALNAKILPFPLSLSIGVFETDGEPLDEILHSVDREMYTNKVKSQEASVLDMPANLLEEWE